MRFSIPNDSSILANQSTGVTYTLAFIEYFYNYNFIR